jgi:GNAT superfamily N-acetyltransferase
MLARGNERFSVNGAIFIRNRMLVAIRDANHVGCIRDLAAARIDSLLRSAETEFSGIPYRRFDTDPLTPPAIEARLVLDGYVASTYLAMVLEGPLRATPRAFEIRLVHGTAAWNRYASLLRRDVHAWGGVVKPDEEARFTEMLLMARRGRVPAVRYWMAYVDGEAVAYCSSWPAPNGVGQVEDLFTHPGFRHRGLGTALIAHCIADCRSRGAREVFLVTDAADTPKQMYAALGFQPLAVVREYERSVDSQG